MFIGAGGGYAAFLEDLHQEDKRCMLVSVKLEPDFSRGCAGRRMGHLLFATHPHRLTISEVISAPLSSRN
jgi:hypothetical protein